MKFLRFLPLCLAALALPLVMTGCNNAGSGSTASTDTNAAPADTNAPAPASAPADTNAAPATNAPASTNSGT
jgi:hypothetical protein